MNPAFQTLLLLTGPPNEDLTTFLKSLGLYANISLEDCRQARLGIEPDGQPGLWLEARNDVDALFLRNEQVVPEILAFSCAPRAVLRKLHGAQFTHRTRWIEVVYEPDNLSIPGGSAFGLPPAFAARVLRLRFATSAPTADAEALSHVYFEQKPPHLPLLIINPIVIPLKYEQAIAYFRKDALALSGINGFLMPPVRAGDEDSYFQPARLEVRRTISALAGPSRADEPMALTLWRAADDPAVRDFLMDGARLDLTLEVGEPTRLVLMLPEFSGPKADPVAAYRSAFLFRPSDLPGDAWKIGVSAAVLQDLADITPASEPPQLVKIPARESGDGWTLPEREPAGEHPEPFGSWLLFQGLEKNLPKQQRLRFHEEILTPLWNFNNDAAERAFVRNFWRCPWGGGTDADSWRLAMVHLLSRELVGVQQTPYEHLSNRSSQGWPRLRRVTIDDRKRFILGVPGWATPDIVLEWMLLLPLGSVVKGGTVHLNTVYGTLTDGYVLA